MGMASTRRTDVREGLDGIRAASVELSRLQDPAQIVERALDWALTLTGMQVAFIRTAGDEGVEELRLRLSDPAAHVSPEDVEALIAETGTDRPQEGRPSLLRHASIRPLEAGGQRLGMAGVGGEAPMSPLQEQALSAFVVSLAAIMLVADLQRRRQEMVDALVNLRIDLDQSEHQRQIDAARAESADRVERAHELAVAALHAVSVHARSGHDQADFYRRLTASIAEVVGASMVLFWQLDEAEGTLTAIPGAHGIDRQFLSRLYPSPCSPNGDDLTSRVVYGEQAFRASRRAGGDFTQVLDTLGVEDAISVPWRAGDERLGLVAAYNSTSAEGFSREDTWVLQEVGLVAGLVWQLKRAETDLQKTVDRLQKVDAARQLLLKNVSSAVDKAGRRFTSELHDDALQKLTAAELHLQRVKDLDARNGSILAEASKLLAETEESLRRLLFEVRPPSLDDPGGLAESISERLAMLRSLMGAEVEVEAELELDRALPYQLKSTVFRQVAEALANIEKHAGATRVKVAVKVMDDAVHGMVVDNGRGFVVAERNNLPGHLGLLSLKERAILAGGWYKIESEPGIGTNIEFWLPIA
jgi:signal transduction histidine kinase